jgi:hypothetical protein
VTDFHKPVSDESLAGKKTGSRSIDIGKETVSDSKEMPLTARLPSKPATDPVRNYYNDLWRLVAPGEIPEPLLHALYTSKARSFVVAEPEPSQPMRPLQPSTRLAGTAEEVRLQLFDAFLAARGDPKALFLFTRGTLANALLDLQVRLKCTPVQVVDTALFMLRQYPPPFAGFMPAIATQMRYTIETSRQCNSDWLATCSSLGDLLGMGQNYEASCRSVVYYHEALCGLWRDWSDGAPRPEPERRTQVHILSVTGNNLAAELGRIIQTRGRPREAAAMREQAAVVVRRLARCSIGAALQQPTADLASLDLTSLRELPLFQAFNYEFGSPPWEKFILMIRELANNSLANPLPEDSTQVAYFEACAGVLRVALGEADRAASSFFNAGVSLLRAREQGSPRRQFALARLLLNTFGLQWALVLNSQDIRVALTTGDGMDCAVNLFGAAVDVSTVPPGLKPEAKNAIANLAGVVGDMESQLVPDGLVESMEFGRLRRSWDRLGLSVEPRRSTLDTWVDICTRIIQAVETELFPAKAQLADAGSGNASELAVSSDVKSPEKTSFDMAAAMRSTAILTRRIFEESLFEDPRPQRDELWQVLGEMAKQMDDPVGMFQAAYAPYMEGAGADELGSSHASPLIDAGIVTQEQWSAFWNSRMVPCDLLGDAFRKFGSDVLDSAGPGDPSTTAP